MTDRIIKAVTVMQAGPIAGQPGKRVDSQTLRELVSMGNSGKVVKARYGKPKFWQDQLGNYLGRWRNFRLSPDGNSVLADLHLADIAHDPAKPANKLARYVKALANEDPTVLAAEWAGAEVDAEKLGGSVLRIQRLTAIDLVEESTTVRGGLFAENDHGTSRGAPSVRQAQRPRPKPASRPKAVRTTPKGFDFMSLNFKTNDVTTDLNGELELRHYSADAPVRINPSRFGLDAAEVTALKGASKWLEEYARNDYDLRRSGISLDDYFSTAHRESNNGPLPPELRRAGEKLQEAFGRVGDPSDPLTPV